MRRGQFNNAIYSLPTATVQISLGIVALFEKIYDREPILTVFQKRNFFPDLGSNPYFWGINTNCVGLKILYSLLTDSNLFIYLTQKD